MQRRSFFAGCAALGVVGTAAALGGRYMGGNATRAATPTLGDGVNGPKGMVWLPGGQFLMGNASKQAQPNELPAHPVHVSGYWIDLYDVTNADFARFVAATGYRSTAEQAPRWEDLRLQLPPGTAEPDPATLVPGGMVFTGTRAPVQLSDWARWWAYVPGADWRHPLGPDSSIAGLDRNPVTQVSHADAVAYATWAGKRLPTEAQWEFAARGGLEQAEYAWGNEFAPGGKRMANSWDDQARQFPVLEDEKVQVGTMPVGSYPANGYGLYDMSGNVWQWCADWYRIDAFSLVAGARPPRDPLGPVHSFDTDDGDVPPNAPKRVMRGGSFLCSEDYCTSFRTSARRGTDPNTSMSHLGFRTVMTQDDWLRLKRPAARRS